MPVPTLLKGDVVVMENLPAHKGPRVEELIKAAGARSLRRHLQAHRMRKLLRRLRI